jgi:hypothetical protein
MQSGDFVIGDFGELMKLWVTRDLDPPHNENRVVWGTQHFQ